MNNGFKITDDRFSESRTDLYDLTFEVQFTRLRFMIRHDDQLMWLEDHFLGYSNDIATCEKAIADLISEHPFLAVRFWKSVKLISDFQIHTLLPASDFEPAKSAKYLASNFPTADLQQLDIIHETISDHTLVAGLVKTINDTFRIIYPDLIIDPTALVGLKHFSALQDTPFMGVISETCLDLYIKNPRNKTISIIRSLLRNLEQLPTYSADLLLYGEATPYSSSYRLLTSRFNAVIMGNTLERKELRGEFSGLPPQRYFTLLASS